MGVGREVWYKGLGLVSGCGSWGVVQGGGVGYWGWVVGGGTRG